ATRPRLVYCLLPSSVLQAADSEEQGEDGHADIERQVPGINQAAAEIAAEMLRNANKEEPAIQRAAGIDVRPPETGDDERQPQRQRQQGRHQLIANQAADEQTYRQ